MKTEGKTWTAQNETERAETIRQMNVRHAANPANADLVTMKIAAPRLFTIPARPTK